ncbi:hypothetical protein HDU88_000476 [Geranomyces variabilis]|nr:hypothetical protein HDU88_000476 [Geranomyces variabilis]
MNLRKEKVTAFKEAAYNAQERKRASESTLEELRQKRLKVHDVFEANIGCLWSTADDLVTKFPQLVDARLVADTHTSLLRRTVAINIEFELKQQLVGLDTDPNTYYQDEDILRLTIKQAKEIAEKCDPDGAQEVLQSWFPDANHSLRKFSETMQLLKVASHEVHPVHDMDRNKLDRDAVSKLLHEDFDIPAASRLAGRTWGAENKDVAVHYLNKLQSIRSAASCDRLLFS